MKVQFASKQIFNLAIIAVVALFARVAVADPVSQSFPITAGPSGGPSQSTECVPSCQGSAVYVNSAGQEWNSPPPSGTVQTDAIFQPLSDDGSTNSADTNALQNVWFTSASDTTNVVLVGQISDDVYTNSAGEVYISGSSAFATNIVYVPDDNDTNGDGSFVLTLPTGDDDDATDAGSKGLTLLPIRGIVGHVTPIVAPVASTTVTLTDISGYPAPYNSICVIMDNLGNLYCGADSVTAKVVPGRTYAFIICVVDGISEVGPAGITFWIDWN